MHVDKELNEIIEKVASDLRAHYRIPQKALELQNFNDQLRSLFSQRCHDSLLYLDKHRIRHEVKLVHSIRRKLHRKNHIMRVTDKSGVFHIGSLMNYERKVKEYQLKTNAHLELSSNSLMETYDKVVRLLNDLRSKSQIAAWHYLKMMSNKNKTRIAYLYFIPKPYKVMLFIFMSHFVTKSFYIFQQGTSLRPIISGKNAPTTNISKRFDKLIRPLFDEYVQQTTMIDGIFLRRLQKYVSLGLLKPTTLLCTFDITDLYTMLPQEEAIDILKKFLVQFNHHHVKGMTLYAIESLARIVLTENVFIYNNKYYRQVKGGAVGSPFTLTLVNISCGIGNRY